MSAVSDAVESAEALIGWLEELRRLPDVDREMLHGVDQALRHARKLARYVTSQWINEPALPALPAPSAPTTGGRGRG